MFQNQPLSSLSPPGEVKQEGGSVFREGTPYQRRGSLQLWQFLVALLDDPGNAHFIAWTGRGMEFKLIEPEEVSSLREGVLLQSVSSPGWTRSTWRTRVWVQSSSVFPQNVASVSAPSRR